MNLLAFSSFLPQKLLYRKDNLEERAASYAYSANLMHQAWERRDEI
jgi:hypothetical protein